MAVGTLAQLHELVCFPSSSLAVSAAMLVGRPVMLDVVVMLMGRCTEEVGALRHIADHKVLQLHLEGHRRALNYEG